MGQEVGTAESRIRIGGIMHWSNLVRLGVMKVPDRPGVAAAIFSGLGARGVNVPFIIQSIDLRQQTHIAFCVAASDHQAALQVLRELEPELGAAVLTEEPGVSLVSVFGPDFRERAGIAGAVFGAMSRVGVNILAISTSISTVSCLIRREDLDSALEALQSTFILP